MGVSLLEVVRVESHEPQELSVFLNGKDHSVRKHLFDIRANLFSVHAEKRNLPQQPFVLLDVVSGRIVQFDKLSHRLPPAYALRASS